MSELDGAPCPEPGDLVEPAIDRILTQYRESPNLIDLLRAVLGQAEEAAIATCEIPSHFDILTAVGEQLTFIGLRMGWPRCHCICATDPVFGFVCEGFPSDFQIAGFCETDDVTWIDCGVSGLAEVCIEADDIYRRFLLARRYQMIPLFDRESLTAALQHIWGETATVLDEGHGRVVLAPGRDLTDIERSLIQLVPRVLPVAPGIRQRFHFGDTYVFGFGEGWGGFCEPTHPDGLPLATESGAILTGTVCDVGEGEGEGEGEGDCEEVEIATGPLTDGAPWMCEIDVLPYDCP